MTRPPHGVITSPSIRQPLLTHFSPSLPFYFLLLLLSLQPSSLGKNYLDGQSDWLSWATIWCLFQLKWNCLVLSINLWHRRAGNREYSHMINYNMISHLHVFSPFQTDHMFPQKDLEINLQPSQIYCCSRLLHEIDFTPYSCKWWLACQSPQLPTEREAKQRQLEVESEQRGKGQTCMVNNGHREKTVVKCKAAND